MESKVDKTAYERHQIACADQNNKFHSAILDLYRKDEKTQSVLREMEIRNADRHIELLNAIREK